MARCIPPIWIWSGCPESGRAIHRAEDLDGDSGATFKMIVPIHAAQPTAARGMVSSDANLSDPLRLLHRACRDLQVQETARREGSLRRRRPTSRARDSLRQNLEESGSFRRVF